MVDVESLERTLGSAELRNRDEIGKSQSNWPIFLELCCWRALHVCPNIVEMQSLIYFHFSMTVT